MRNPWIVYILARLGVFIAVLAVLILLGLDPFFSAAIAAIVGLAISLLFFSKQRDRVSNSVYNMVNKDKNSPTAENAEDHMRAGTERHLGNSDHGGYSEEH